MRRPLPQPARGPHRAAELRHPARTAPPVMLICFARLLRSSPADGDTYGERVTAQTRRDCRVLGEFRIGALCSDPCTARDPVQLTEHPCPGKWKTHPCVSDSHLNEGRSGDAAHHVAEYVSGRHLRGTRMRSRCLDAAPTKKRSAIRSRALGCHCHKHIGTLDEN